MKTKMNAYNIFNEEEYSTILFHAIARDEDHVRELAEQSGISLDGLTIELERSNVRDELGRPAKPAIFDAIVH